MLAIIYQIFRSFTETEKKIFWGVLAIFIISSILWGFLVLQNKTIPVPIQSNLYREGMLGQPINVNPVLAGTNDSDRDLIELLFSDLLDLTESYTVSDDGQTWKMKLKADLRWDDGKPVTADDVIFTIDTIQDSGSRSPIFPTWQGVIVNRISEREVEFTLRTPYAFFLNNLQELKLLPKHIFGSIPPENIRLSNFNLEPVGNGPYQFSSMEKRKDGFITDYHLETNRYFAGEKPYLENLDIKFYASSDELINAFNLKRIDGFGGLNPKNVNDLKFGNQILEKLMPRYYAIFLNKNTKPSLVNKEVLKALELATNKEKIIGEVFNGRAIVINSPLPAIIEGYDRNTDPGHEFSLEKAIEILSKDKWLLNEKTQVREKKVGRQMETLEYAVIVPQISFLTQTVEIIKEDWAKIGVKLNPIIMNPEDILNEVIKTRNYPMILFGNVLKGNSDIFSFWHSSERFYPGLNLALYENKKVDALLESVRKNLEAEDRIKDLSQIQKLINEDKPAIFLYSPAYLYAGPKDLGGFEESVLITAADRFENVNKWYLETTRVFK